MKMVKKFLFFSTRYSSLSLSDHWKCRGGMKLVQLNRFEVSTYSPDYEGLLLLIIFISNTFIYIQLSLSFYLYPSISFHLSLSIYTYLSICLSPHLSLFIYHYPYISIHLSLAISIVSNLSISVCLYRFISIHL